MIPKLRVNLLKLLIKRVVGESSESFTHLQNDSEPGWEALKVCHRSGALKYEKRLCYYILGRATPRCLLHLLAKNKSVKVLENCIFLFFDCSDDCFWCQQGCEKHTFHHYKQMMIVKCTYSMCI